MSKTNHHTNRLHEQYIPLAYTPETAALVAGRSRTRIFKAIKAKELTAHKDGRCTLIEAAELQRWIRTFPAIGREAIAA